MEIPSENRYVDGEMAVRASRLAQRLKNVVMLQIAKLKANRKIPKLKEILNLAIQA